MPTYPLPTLAAQITLTGISAPPFSDLINSDVATYQGIYGEDAVLTPDAQDYQLLATRDLAINDCNNLAIAVYNAILIAFAQGTGLSALVQLAGINREVPTNSTAVVDIGGVAGTVISGGLAGDTNNNLWNLPASVTIPDAGTIPVTVTAQQPGAISAVPGSINTPYTIVLGWQTVSNPAAATPGAPVETDAALRRRFIQSTSLPSQTPLSSILAAVANTGGIGRYQIYENQGNTTDGNGVPGHSIAVVVEGGDATTIAQVIQEKKSPGTGTYGTTSVTVEDPSGIPITINFFEMTAVPIYAAITIQPLTGYVASTGAALVDALGNFIASLTIGQSVIYNWCIGAAGLSGSPLEFTFEITSLTIGISSMSLSAGNVAIAFNAGATIGSIILTGA